MLPVGCPMRTSHGDNEGLDQRCNDLREIADPIAFGDTLTGIIGTPDPDDVPDFDVFSFAATAGEVVEITLTPGAGSEFLPYARFSSGVLSHEIYGETTTAAVTRQAVVDTTGTQFVTVTDVLNTVGDFVGGATFTYSITLRRLTISSTAITTFPYASGVRTIGAARAVDGYTFSALAGQHLTLVTAATSLTPPSGVDTQLILLDVSNAAVPVLLAALDDIPGGETDAELSYTFTTATNVLVVVDHYDIYGTEQTYTLNATLETMTSGVNAEIQAVRDAADAAGTTAAAANLPVNGATVTYIKPFVTGANPDGDAAGFFVQGTQAGPGLFVAGDASTLAVGNTVSFTVTQVIRRSGSRQASAISGLMVTGNTDVNTLRFAASGVDLAAVGAVDAYDNELISLNGTVATAFGAAGTSYSSAQITTAGVTTASAAVKLRIPTTLLQGIVDFGPGCTFSVSGPVWRFASGSTEAQVSAWTMADLTGISCPGPRLTSASALSGTSVRLTFDRDIDAASVMDVGTAFSFSGALMAGGVGVVTGRNVTVTTGPQVGGIMYTVTATGGMTGVRDTRGTPVQVPGNTAMFSGFNGCGGPRVVISQVYGGGGNGGATYTHDFVELHNRSSMAVDVSGWSIQYTSATGTSWGSNSNKLNLTGSVAANGYYLIQLGTSGMVGSALPTPSATGTIGMSGTQGKIALVSSQTGLPAVNCPGAADGVLDMVGYGVVDCSEGMADIGVLSSQLSAQRNNLTGMDVACIDTDNNAADFETLLPAPRNAMSPVSICSCMGN